MRTTGLALALVVVLGMTAIFVAPADATNDPPPSGGTVYGNWNVTDARSYTGVSIIIDRGNLTIKSGGSLTLDNISLQFRMNFSGQNSIEVESGGKLVIKNRSSVFSSNPDRHLYFRIRPGATAYLAGSAFRDMGNTSNYNISENDGVYIASGNVTVDFCEFTNSTFGLYLDRVGPTVNGCGFHNLDYIGVCALGSNSTLTGNDFGGTYYGVYVTYYGSPRISNNTFRDNGRSNAGGAAIFSDFSGGRFDHNTIQNAAFGMGVMCTESASPLIDNCTINTTGNAAVYADTHADPRIYDCNISCRNSSAIFCTASSSVAAQRSGISSSGYIGVYATYSSVVDIANCTVRPANYYALYMTRSAAITARDTDIEARSYGAYCSASVLHLQGVNITSNTSIGIAMTGASTAVLERVFMATADVGISASCDGRGIISMTDCSVIAKNSTGMAVTGTRADIIDSSVYSTRGLGLYSLDRGIVFCQNSTIGTGSSGPVICLDRGGGNFYNFTNVVFDEFKVQFTEPTSALDIHWFLGISVVWQSFVPAPGAAVNVTDIDGGLVLEGVTDSRGELPRTPVREYRRTQQGWSNDTSHDITAFKNGVSKMERRAIRSNTNVRVLLSDPDPPVVKMAYPSNGAYLITSGLAVRGTAEDYVSGVARVEYRVDDGAWTPAEGLEDWKFDVELADGQHMLRVRAVDLAGSAREAAASVFVDTQISLDVEYPPEEAMLNSTEVAVSGLAEPYSNVTANDLTALVESDGVFAILVHLEEGPQTITVIAADVAGNLLTVVRHVTVDTVPPRLAIISPANGSTTPNRFIAFNGTVETGARVYIGGQNCPVEDGGFSVMVPLEEGDNAVAVMALDATGNANIIAVHIVSDTTAPVINCSIPLDGAIVSRPSVTVSGESDGVSVLVDGKQATLNGSRFSGELTLEEGENAVEISALDAVGNVNRTVVHLTLDTRPPFLLVVSPPVGHITNLASLSIQGACEPKAVVTVNGQRANNTNGSLGLTLKLGPGDNILEIKAVDSAGNAAYANRTVVLDQTPPPLTITEPASGLRTSEGSITLRGATDPWCTVSINGEAVTVDRKGKFAKELSLDEGDNTLVVTSVDMGGNPTTRLVRVVRTGALSMGGSEAPVLLAGLTIGVVVGVAAGFLAAARLRRRRADIAAPEEPVPGGYDIPEEPRAPGQAVQKHVHHARDPADQKMALPSVPEPEPLDDAAAGRAAGEKRKGAGGGRRA